MGADTRSLAQALKRGLSAGELTVHYQPQVDVQTGRCVGAEALARWTSPEHGSVPPIEFIPVAESSGLIDELADHVLATALRDRAAWATAGHEIPVSVNASAVNLLSDSFAARVADRLAEAQTEPRWLTLELTESALLRDPERSNTVLADLKTAGVGLSLDDFGTGYSSLSRLRRLPIDEIKIDRSFVQVIDLPIVRLVAELGALLGHRIVAEGVERREDVPALAHLGCHSAQGYAVARPMPSSSLVAWLCTPRLPDIALPPVVDTVDVAMNALHELGALARDLAAGDKHPRDALCRRLRSMMAAAVVALWEPTPDGTSLAVTGSDGLSGPRPVVSLSDEHSGVVAAFHSGRSSFAPDVATHPVANTRLAARFGARSALWHPVGLPERGAGALVVAWSAPRQHLSPTLRLAVSAVADHAALLIGDGVAMRQRT